MGWFLVIAGLCLLCSVNTSGKETPGVVTITVFWVIACTSIIAMGVAINKDWFF